ALETASRPASRPASGIGPARRGLLATSLSALPRQRHAKPMTVQIGAVAVLHGEHGLAVVERDVAEPAAATRVARDHACRSQAREVSKQLLQRLGARIGG